MDKQCLLCAKPLRKVAGRFNRRSLNIKINSKSTVKDVVMRIFETDLQHQSKYVCEWCYNAMRKMGTAQANLEKMENEILFDAKGPLANTPMTQTKRKLILDTQVKSETIEIKPIVVTEREADRINFRDPAHKSLKNSRYHELASHLSKRSESARKAFRKHYKGTIRREIQREKASSLSTLMQKVTLDTLADFDWGEQVAKFEKGCPYIMEALKAMVLTRSEEKTGDWKDKVAGLGNLVATALALRQPKCFTFVKTVLALQIKRSGPNHEKDDTVRALKAHRYSSLVHRLSKRSFAARREFRRHNKTMIRQEIYREKEGCLRTLRQKVTLDSLAEFDWSEQIEKFEKGCPYIMSALKGMVLTRLEESSGDWKDKMAGMGNLVAIALALRKPNSFTFVKTLLAIQIKRSGASSELLHTLNQLGISASNNTANRTLDALCADQDTSAHQTNEEQEIKQEAMDADNDDTVDAGDDEDYDNDDEERSEGPSGTNQREDETNFATQKSDSKATVIGIDEALDLSCSETSDDEDEENESEEDDNGIYDGDEYVEEEPESSSDEKDQKFEIG